MTTPEVQVGAARSAAPRAPIGPIVAGVVLVAVGAFLLREAFGEIDGGELLIGGPRLAPIVVSAGWVAIAVVYLVHQVIAWRLARGSIADDKADSEGKSEIAGETDGTGVAAASPRWLTPALLVGALIAYVLLLDWLGFVIATAAFFVSATRILRSTHLLRDIEVAVPLAVGVYLGFTRLLEIHLPEGLLPL